MIGPTAIGKTSLAIALAQYFNTHVVSADSRQFYKEMQLGTAVPSITELLTVPHHFIQHKSILESYNVGNFEKEALELLSKLFQNKDVVVLVGGSALYMNAVLYGLDHFPTVDPTIRENLQNELNEKGIEHLQRRLKSLDPKYHAQVDTKNPHRLIRALEVCIASDTPYSAFLNQEKTPRPFHSITIGLKTNRTALYERINSRVEQMIKDGLLEEAKALYQYRNRNALNTVGYKELFSYFDGKCSLPEAIEEIKKNTRRFAKRQLTWYRNSKTISWIDYQEPFKSVLQKIKTLMLTENNLGSLNTDN